MSKNGETDYLGRWKEAHKRVGKMGTVLISPGMAAFVLSRSQALGTGSKVWVRNRRIDRAAVEGWKKTIASNEWDPDAGVVQLTRDYTVVNFQHRGTAIAEGNTSVNCAVIFDVSPETLGRTDAIVKPRRFGAQVYMLGHANADRRAALSTSLHWMETDHHNASHSERLEAYKRHAALIDKAEKVMVGKGIERFPATVIAPFVFCARIDEEKALGLLRQLVTGIGRTPGGAAIAILGFVRGKPATGGTQERERTVRKVVRAIQLEMLGELPIDRVHDTLKGMEWAREEILRLYGKQKSRRQARRSPGQASLRSS
jgi:hypothetical protein